MAPGRFPAPQKWPVSLAACCILGSKRPMHVDAHTTTRALLRTSCPAELEPQHQVPLSVVMPQVCRPPALRCSHWWPPATSTGRLLSTPVQPSWPALYGWKFETAVCIPESHAWPPLANPPHLPCCCPSTTPSTCRSPRHRCGKHPQSVA